jgi:hypothetical protein
MSSCRCSWLAVHPIASALLLCHFIHSSIHSSAHLTAADFCSTNAHAVGNHGSPTLLTCSHAAAHFIGVLATAGLLKNICLV